MRSLVQDPGIQLCYNYYVCALNFFFWYLSGTGSCTILHKSSKISGKSKEPIISLVSWPYEYGRFHGNSHYTFSCIFIIQVLWLGHGLVLLFNFLWCYTQHSKLSSAIIKKYESARPYIYGARAKIGNSHYGKRTHEKLIWFQNSI